MGMQMTMIEVDLKTAAILQSLRVKAEAMGLSLDALLNPLLEAENENRPAPPPRNEAMSAVLQRSAERLKDVPVSGTTEDTIKLIRAARGGEMWGYEPTE